MGDAYARLLAKQVGLKAEPVHDVTTLPPSRSSCPRTTSGWSSARVAGSRY